MRCSWCGGEVLPDMTFTYETVKRPMQPELIDYLADALAGREFCSGRCIWNYMRAVVPEEQEEYKAG